MAGNHAEKDALSRVFKPRESAAAPTGVFNDNQVKPFSQNYCASMRDMLTFGVASNCCGLPAYLLRENAHLVDRHFPNTSGLIREREKPTMKVRQQCGQK